jgi:hypothetical protein
MQTDERGEMITDLDEVARLAAAQRDEFEVVRYMLEAEDDLDDAKLDAWVNRLAAPIIAAIDCRQCANCCRKLDVYLEAEDGARLADGLMIPLDAIATVYVDRAAGAAQEAWGMFRAKPCAFLRGNLCTVYTHRPEACRVYPEFTPDFRWTMADAIEGAALCPIIYHVLAAVAREIDRKYSALAH